MTIPQKKETPPPGGDPSVANVNAFIAYKFGYATQLCGNITALITEKLKYTYKFKVIHKRSDYGL